jgi:hypothetical protein
MLGGDITGVFNCNTKRTGEQSIELRVRTIAPTPRTARRQRSQDYLLDHQRHEFVHVIRTRFACLDHLLVVRLKGRVQIKNAAVGHQRKSHASHSAMHCNSPLNVTRKTRGGCVRGGISWEGKKRVHREKKREGGRTDTSGAVLIPTTSENIEYL